MSLPARGIVAAPIAAHGRPIEDVLDAAAHGLLHLSARLAELERGFPVCIGGFHVSGCIRCCRTCRPRWWRRRRLESPFLPAKPRSGGLTRCCAMPGIASWLPLYNHMKDLPALAGEPPPILPRKHVRAHGGIAIEHRSGARLPPIQCSFCTIINVQGRKSRFRSADDLEPARARERCPRHQALLHHRRQFCPKPRLGEIGRPPNRAAGARD